VLQTPEAANMIRSLFVSMQELNKGARRPETKPNKIKKIGILGAGFMGAGIAYVTAKAGIGGADRPRPGSRRQGQGAFRRADSPRRCKRGRATQDKRKAACR
jgi:3-hydroxyacyl-CoA dehydrogenase/enoyl-CoA hydratase/3-hydroxybutyryl-CoA epimerase